jgi:preprotein translocase subunit SecE
LTDIRRGFEFPGQSSPLGGYPQIEGWARERGCPDIETRPANERGSSTMAFSPFKFLQEVRTETAKVTWPSRRETTITTIMVFLMVALASIFFFFSDQIIRVFITFVLGLH